MKKFLDAHCHLADERMASNLQNELDEAKKAGVTRFISSALCREEFTWHQQNQFPGMYWSAGIHPFYEKSDEKDFEFLIKFCDEKQIAAIGEIGLDGRNKNSEWQKQILLQQLDLAANYDLPVVFHVVHKYYDLYKIIKNNFPKIHGYLHAFNSSLDVAENFSKFDLAFSIGCKPPKKEVLQYIFNRSLILCETDAPYQKPHDSKEDFNHLKNLGLVVENIKKTCNCSFNNIFSVQNKTINMIFEDKLEVNNA
ncbi:MAG: TatD family hydrolase [Candidatus Cloacimonetes bacterium]|nr:TatD family hydrolase [Candidatus Cloacimonadota bacterium]MCF7813485.1 TatD family hydrolase [Candidatus Cloacimonadota bacterium]MCF7868592.1 TatD family hydrolase [Candidatus Cloacimonadota bacterium]MCF7883379.1 TatD family hydrolase [Candidatus Cloacimonadota bacterium]